MASRMSDGIPDECQAPQFERGDCNVDGAVDIGDAIYVLGTLFGGGAPVPPPSGECGEDPTADSLDCADFDAC